MNHATFVPYPERFVPKAAPEAASEVGLRLVLALDALRGGAPDGAAAQLDAWDEPGERCLVLGAEILAEIDAALADIESILPGLTPAQLASPFPVEIEGRTIPTRIFLWRLAVHLAYHLGQAVTVRRALAG